MGIFSNDGTVRINPPMNTQIGTGDRIIAISEDDDTIQLATQAPSAIETSLIRSGARRK